MPCLVDIQKVNPREPRVLFRRILREIHSSFRKVLQAEPPKSGCVPRSVEKERRPPLRHQSIRSGGNLRVFENLAQTLVAVDAS